jgi:hypothetical protein
LYTAVITGYSEVIKKGYRKYDSPSFCTFVDNNVSFSYIITVMKGLLPTLLFFFLLNSISIAQQSATANGTFAVAAYMTVIKLADLNFGTIFVGTTLTIEPTSPQAAAFLFNGNSSTTTEVTITFPNDLISGSNTINFNTPSRPTYNTIPNAMTATEFKKKTGGSAQTGTDGNLYVWVGGRVRAANKQATGTYTGIMQIVIVQP